MIASRHLTSTAAFASLVTVSLVLTGCSDKKDTFKKEMAAWIEAHPTGLNYCTTLKVPSSLGSFSITFGEASFYRPSKVFTDANQHPIVAIEKATAAPSPVLKALLKAGLVRTEPVKHTKYTESFSTVPGKFLGHPTYHYVTTSRTAYILVKSAGWQTNATSLDIATTPHTSSQQPKMKMITVSTVADGSVPMSPAWCGGKVNVTKITEYTEPASELGRIVSHAKAILTVSGLPAWLNDPAIKRGLGAPPKSQYGGNADFVKTSNGWRLSGGVHAPGLYGAHLL